MHLLIHPSVDEHLGGVHVLAIANSITMNIGYFFPFEPWFPPDIKADHLYSVI